MKVYIHFEDTGGLNHSMGCEFKQDSSTPLSLINNFVQSFNLAHPKHPLAANGLCLVTSEGKKLSSSTIAELSDRDDIVIREIDPQSSRVLPAAKAKLEGNTSACKDQEQQLNSIEIATYKKEIEDHIAVKSYRKARILAEKCLTLVNVESYFFFSAIAQIKLANEEFESAVKYASLAVTAAGKASVDASVFKFTLARALFHLGDRFEEADEILEKLLSNQLPSQLQNIFKLDVRALRAECLFDLNQHEAAANLVNGHMHWAGAEEHLPTLLAYTRFAMTYRKVEEPVRAMLKAVVLDQNNPLCRKMLAELLSSDAGYTELMRQVPPTPISAAAYAFVARVVKDCSAMQPCIRLLTEALRSKPDSASFVLNLSHSHEIMGDLKKAVDVIKAFCGSNTSTKVGSYGFSAADLLIALNSDTASSTGGRADEVTSAVQQDTTTTSSSSSSWYDFSERKNGFKSTLDSDKTALVTSGRRPEYTKEDLDFLAVAFTAVKISYLSGNFSVLPALHDLIEPCRQASSEPLHLTSTRNENAYYLCIMDVLAERGVIIDPAPLTVTGDCTVKSYDAEKSPVNAVPSKVSNPTKKSVTSKTNLKSFCGDFRSTKLSLDPSILLEASQNPIYICGDSHCLSPAWSVINTQESHSAGSDPAVSGTKSTPRLLVPRLVTGIKQWHVRPKGVFYPKLSFQRTIEAIPSGADVIFLIGEIDCREGLLVAVERDRYASLVEGMERTIDIFLAALVKIIAVKKFNVFIHPIAPVLNETRALVKQFNLIYKKKVELVKGIVWLDFFSDLLTEDQGDLNPLYAMDGTHLHPSYVGLIASTLQMHYNSSS